MANKHDHIDDSKKESSLNGTNIVSKIEEIIGLSILIIGDLMALLSKNNQSYNTKTKTTTETKNNFQDNPIQCMPRKYEYNPCMEKCFEFHRGLCEVCFFSVGFKFEKDIPKI
jgi:hypothetical protein